MLCMLRVTPPPRTQTQALPTPQPAVACVITSILIPLGEPDIFEDRMAFYGNLIGSQKRPPSEEQIQLGRLLDSLHEARMQRLRQATNA